VILKPPMNADRRRCIEAAEYGCLEPQNSGCGQPATGFGNRTFEGTELPPRGSLGGSLAAFPENEMGWRAAGAPTHHIIFAA
jgi:hypothetical protein